VTSSYQYLASHSPECCPRLFQLTIGGIERRGQ
jgi:hypothetical protein